MKRKKYIGVFLAAVLILCSCTGCWGSKELTDMVQVIGTGLDNAENGQTKLTVQAGSASTSKSDNKKKSAESQIILYQKTGNGIFDMVRDITHESNRRLFIGHNQCIVFGKEDAQKGVKNQLDFFLRDSEARMDVNILVSDSTAEEILSTQTEDYDMPAVGIKQLLEMQQANAESVSTDLMDFSLALASETTCPVASMIHLSKSNGKPRFVVSGTAVFKKDKLVGTLDEEKTRGYLWAMNKMKNGVVNIQSHSQPVCLEILGSRAAIKPVLQANHHLTVHFPISVKLGIREIKNQDGISYDELSKQLEQDVSHLIQKKISDCFHETQLYGTDIYGVGKLVEEKYPQDWDNIKDKWDTLYRNSIPEVSVEVKVKDSGKISKTYG